MKFGPGNVFSCVTYGGHLLEFVRAYVPVGPCRSHYSRLVSGERVRDSRNVLAVTLGKHLRRVGGWLRETSPSVWPRIRAGKMRCPCGLARRPNQRWFNVLRPSASTLQFCLVAACMILRVCRTEETLSQQQHPRSTRCTGTGQYGTVRYGRGRP